MAVNRVDFGGNTLIDLTGDTLESAEQLLKGIIAHAKDGSQIVGTLEAGGEGVSGITYGIYIPSVTGTSHIIAHGLGVVPKLFAICAGSYSMDSSGSLLDCAHGFSDRNLLFRMSRTSSGYSPTGYIHSSVNITQSFFAKNTAIANATAESISVGGRYNLTAGVEYYWFAVA